jgi:hypothetical protein
MTRLPYNRIAIIGGGLIGTSIAHAIRVKDPDCLIQFADADAQAVEVLLGKSSPTALRPPMRPRRCAMPIWCFYACRSARSASWPGRSPAM